MIKAEHLEEEPDNDNTDSCDVCKMRLTADRKAESRTTRRNPSRSAKRNVVYREYDLKEDASLNLYSKRLKI